MKIKELLYSLSNHPNLKISYTLNNLKLEVIARKYLRDGTSLPIVIEKLMQDSYLQEIGHLFGKQQTIELASYIIQKTLDKEFESSLLASAIITDENHHNLTLASSNRKVDIRPARNLTQPGFASPTSRNPSESIRFTQKEGKTPPGSDARTL